MRFAVMLAAVAALFVQAAPARAAMIELLISGTVAGIAPIISNCPNGQTPNCNTYNTPFTTDFAKILYFLPDAFDDGVEGFATQAPPGLPTFNGTIYRTSQGFFFGTNLEYFLSTYPAASCQNNSSACVGGLYQGSAATFAVTAISGVPGPVPEPATWSMLLLGFGLVGAAMRQRFRSPAAGAPA